MTTRSELHDRFGAWVTVREIAKVADGSAESFCLRVDPTKSLNAPKAARILIQRHLPIAEAYDALTRMMDDGEALVTVPVVEDVAALQAELAAVAVTAEISDLHADGTRKAY